MTITLTEDELAVKLWNTKVDQDGVITLAERLRAFFPVSMDEAKAILIRNDPRNGKPFEKIRVDYKRQRRGFIRLRLLARE